MDFSMSAGEKRSGLLAMYEANLKQRIQQGDWNLVCRDEELCSMVEGLLSKGAAQDIHSALGLDPLSVMENSLQELPTTLGQTGFKRLAKAFEVLELAALNLYVCPWRKEYRVVKTFSGMFTHQVKPALTAQQAKELFGLLGYQPSGVGEEEELRLTSKPVNADCLLQLACAFFTARVECLLLGSGAPLGLCMEWELQLIQERKRGHSLKIAWENAKRKLESAPQNSEHDMTADLDLYTDDHQDPREQEQTNHMAAPPSYSYSPSKENEMYRTSYGNATVPQTQTLCISTVTHEIAPKRYPSSQKTVEIKTDEDAKLSSKSTVYEKQMRAKVAGKNSVPGMGKEPCSCIKPLSLHAQHCLQCREIHEMYCPCLTWCQVQEHTLANAQQHRVDARSQIPQDGEKLSKDHLKNHDCMDKSTSVVFCVCYDCNYIHDLICKDLSFCRTKCHNLQCTGRVQPPQEVKLPPERHSCLREDHPPYVVCHTCNKSHDCLCKEAQSCETSAHSVKYLVEIKKEETHANSEPMPYHECCTSLQPDYACLICREFHTFVCGGEKCHIKHKVLMLTSKCSKCSDNTIFVLCRYCCAEYCKTCWFKNPMACKCGMSFLQSPV